MSNRTYSALTLLAVAGLASSLMACSKEEEKKAGWSCHAEDVPQGEVLRCTSAALTEDGTSQTNLTTDGYTGTTTVGGAGGTAGSAPVGTDGTSATGTATGGAGSTTDGSGAAGGSGTTAVGTDGTSAIGAGSGYGSGSYVPGAGSTNINSDATGAAGVIIYECFPGDTNPDCPPADAYDGMATGGSGGTSTGASLNSDGTASTGDGAGTGGAGGSGTTGSQGTTDGTSATGSTTGGAGSTTGTGGSGTGGGNGGGNGGSTDGTSLNSDGTSSTGNNGNGNGNGGGAGSSNKYPGPDECAYVPDLPYCAGGSAGNSTDGTPGQGGAAGGATASTPDGATTSGTTDGTSSTGTKGNNGNGNGNGNGGSNGNGSKSGDTSGTGGTGGSGDTTGTTGGTSDGTASNGPTGGGSTGGSTPGGSSETTGGGGSSSSGKPIGKHYKCVKDGKGNKSCESIPDCPTGSVPSGGACIDNGSSNGGTGDGTSSTGGSTPSDSSTPGSSEVQRPSEGGCWVTGGGFIISKNNLTGAAADGHDNYGGNAKPMKDGRIQGHWNHVDHGTGNHAKGRPEYIVCRKIDSEPGPAQPGCKKGYCMNQVYFGGHAEWRDHAKGVWESGYWFDVVAKDHGEPGSQPHAKNEGFPDTYHFTIRKIDDPAANASGTVVYEVGRDSVKGGDGVIVGGNIQIHPPNNGHPYTVNTLPSWVKFENPAQ